MMVIYFVNEVVEGNTIPMPKTVVSGFINGLGGKFRMVNIPKRYGFQYADYGFASGECHRQKWYFLNHPSGEFPC